MAKTFFFYDLETSGLNPRYDRIMQFAGVRTDMDFKQIGESHNVLIKLNDDTLPSPEAILVTGITPQATNQDGISEAEFSKFLYQEIFTPDTIAIGFNNIRFDDEFLRYLFWRNFYDPYEWFWKDGRSRWDGLDVVRMTRALRPEGIKWPVDKDGKPTNRLELLTKVNEIDHYKAHDAMSDVKALIAVMTLVKQKQLQLYEYLFKMRDKNEIKKLVNLDDKKPFVYSSGRYESEFNKTTVAFPLTSSRNGNAIVYDLRYDPTEWLGIDSKKLTKLMFSRNSQNGELIKRPPVKELQYNRAPAVAPIGVLSQNDGWQKISLDQATIQKNMKLILDNPSFAETIRTVFENKPEYEKSQDSEALLYEAFVPDVDKIRIESIRQADGDRLADLHPRFVDERLDDLLLRYKARSFPKSLSDDESKKWEEWRINRINQALPSYIETLKKLAPIAKNEQEFILQELQLWAESIMPADY